MMRARLACRSISNGLTNRSKRLPSTKDMKNEWNISVAEGDSASSSIVTMTNFIARDTTPPLDVDDSLTKQFKPFDTYDPFDFSMNQVDLDTKLRRLAATRPKNKDSKDPFERNGINPLHLYTMPFILSRFLTSTGQILSRDITGCNGKNQKKLAIAIKRARACGILSSVHKDNAFLPTRNM